MASVWVSFVIFLKLSLLLLCRYHAGEKLGLERRRLAGAKEEDEKNSAFPLNKRCRSLRRVSADSVPNGGRSAPDLVEPELRLTEQKHGALERLSPHLAGTSKNSKSRRSNRVNPWFRRLLYLKQKVSSLIKNQLNPAMLTRAPPQTTATIRAGPS